jgi:hypothetical protein
VNALGPLSAAVAYRKVENRSRVRLSPFARDPSEAPATFGEPRTSSERVATTARLDWPGRGSFSSNAVYDRYRSLWTDLDLDAEVVPTGSVSLGAGFSRRRPAFDGDSIFNWFSQGTTTAATTRVSIAPTRWFDASLSSGVGWFETEGDPWAAPGDTARDLDRSGHNLTGSVVARLRDGVSELTLLARGDAGDRGHLAGADLSIRRNLGGGVYDVLTLLSLYDWSDPPRRNRDATSFSYVLGAGARTGGGLFSRSRLGLEWEHTLNRLVSQRFRVLATLRLEVFR